MSSATKVAPQGRVDATLQWWRTTRVALARLRDEIRRTRRVPEQLDVQLAGLTDAELEEWFREQLAE